MILPQPRTFLRGYPGVIPHFDYYNRSALIEATRYFPLSSSISCSPSTVVVVTHLCVCWSYGLRVGLEEYLEGDENILV